MCRNNKKRNSGQGHCDRKITWEELKAAIMRLKSKKATGLDAIPGEAINNLPENMKIALLHIFNMMWEISYTPAIWSEAVTTLLHKKESKTLLKNYRPITLLQTIFKTWEAVFETRTRLMMGKDYPPPLQMGSQKHNSAANAIMVTLSLMRQAEALQQKIITLQIDMNKAYNRVSHKILWSDLYQFGIRGKLLKAIMSTYNKAMESIRIGAYKSDPFSLPNGLRQGSVLSPVLYILYTVKLLWALQATSTGLQVEPEVENKPNLPAIMFVDDLSSSMAKTFNEALEQYITVQEFALTHRCVINTNESSAATTGCLQTLTKNMDEAGMTLKPGDGVHGRVGR